MEGAYNTRLDYLKKITPGKAIFSFEYTDMEQAKKVLGGHSCIMDSGTMIDDAKTENIEAMFETTLLYGKR